MIKVIGNKTIIIIIIIKKRVVILWEKVAI